MDKFKESLIAAELKKNNLRETLSQIQDRSSSLLLFSLRWEDLQAHYESLHNVLSQREKEVHALEDSVQRRLRDLEERCRRFDVKRKLGVLDESMKALRKEIEERECEFSKRARLGFEAKGRGTEEKVDVLESMEREIAERLMEIEWGERPAARVFEERDREVERKEKELEELWKKTEARTTEIQCRHRELEKREKDLEELRRKIKSREMEIECRSRELENKEKELEELRRKIKMREKEVDCKDREFGGRRREYEENVVKLEERLRDVERRKRESEIWYEERLELPGIRKREVEGKIGNGLLDEEKLKEWSGEIESRERKLDERVEEVDLKEKRLAELAEKLVSGKRELEEIIKESNLKKQSLEKKLHAFAIEKSKFKERFKKGIVRERRLLEEIKKHKIREEQIQERYRNIDVAKNRLNMAVLAVLRSEEPCNRGVDATAGVVVQHCVVMDGKSLQIFLNEHWEKHDKMRDTVSALVRHCSDPAKLVLDAIVGFYPPHLKHGDHEFEASVVRSSCLLLLEELMEIGPNIKPHVKGEAMKLSFDWITKMSVDSEHSIEVVAFLELVSAYGLADAFDANELLNYAENVAHHRQIPKLCRALGLPRSIAGSPSSKPHHFPIKVKGLRTLLGENVTYELVRDEILCVLKSSSDPAHLVLDAMKNDPSKMMGMPVKGCILLLEDVKKLSPANESPVEAEARQYAKDWISKLELKKDDHMEVICFMQFLLVYNLCRDFEDWEVYGLLDPSCWFNKFNDSCQLLGLSDLLPNFVENLIANKCLLRAIGYICTFKLDDKFPLESLLNNYMMNVMKEAEIMCDDENASPADQIMAMNHKISAVRTALKYVDRYGIGSEDMRICLQDDVEQLEKQKTEKTRKLDAVSNACGQQDDVKTLRMLLSRDAACKLVEDEVFRVLKSSPEPAYLVLNTIKNVDSSHLEKYIQFDLGFPIKNCILLLEQLRSISPNIKCQVRDEAECLKKKWVKKLKKTKDDHMGVLCFIMLHKVYNQSVKLNPSELIGLLNSSCWEKVSESCQHLGLKDVYPESLIRTMIANKQGIKLIKAIKYIVEFRLDEKFCIASLLNDYLSHTRRNADKMCGEKKSDPKAQVQAIQMKIDAATKVVGCVQQHNLYSLYPLRALEDEIEQLYKQKEKACGYDGSSSKGLKRDRVNSNAEDEKFVAHTYSFGRPIQKKKKQNAPERSKQCSSSYTMQPPLPPPLQLLPPPPPLISLAPPPTPLALH